MKAAIYLRVSTDKQDTENTRPAPQSPATQAEAMVRYMLDGMQPEARGEPDKLSEKEDVIERDKARGLSTGCCCDRGHDSGCEMRPGRTPEEFEAFVAAIEKAAEFRRRAKGGK